MAMNSGFAIFSDAASSASLSSSSRKSRVSTVSLLMRKRASPAQRVIDGRAIEGDEGADPDVAW